MGINVGLKDFICLPRVSCGAWKPLPKGGFDLIYLSKQTMNAFALSQLCSLKKEIGDRFYFFSNTGIILHRILVGCIRKKSKSTLIATLLDGFLM